MARVLLILMGVLLLVAAGMELKLRLESSATPTRYSVADLEAGDSVENLNGILGRHYAIYDALVYAYRAPRGGVEPSPEQYIDSMWYPIIASEPTSEADLAKFRVIAKVSSGYRLNNLPEGIQSIEKAEGLFLDGFHSLNGEERELLQMSFPNKNFDDVLLFHAGRERSSTAKIAGLVLGGLALILMPVFMWEPKRKSGAKMANKKR